MRRIAACSSSRRELKPMSVNVFLSLLPWKRSSRARCDEDLAVAGHQTAVAVAAEVLGREEAEDAHVAEAAGATAVVGRAPRLAGVLDHGEAVRLGDLAYGVGVGGEAEEVDRHDRFGARRDRRLDRVGVDAERVGTDVDEHGLGSGLSDRLGRRVEGERYGDDLVAGADAQRAERDREAVGAVGDADGTGGPHIRGGLFLEPFDVRPQDHPPAAQHRQHGVLDAVLQLGVLSLDVHESDGHFYASLRAGEVEPGTYHRGLGGGYR